MPKRSNEAGKRLVEAFDLSIQHQRAADVSGLIKPGAHEFWTVVEHPHVVLRGADGTEHQVLSIEIEGTVTVEHEPLTNRRYRFGTAGVTRGATDSGDLDVLAVQEQGEKLSVQITSKRS